MNSNIPKISVIVPVYNVEKYLSKCIESILAQTFKDFELLLVNDGSIDNSGNICDDFCAKDSRIRVIHKKNEGVSHSRNLGIKLAKGELLTFIDSDDWVDPNLLQTYAANYFETIDSIVVGFIEEFPNNSCIRSISESNNYKMINALVLLELSKYHGYVWNRLYKTSIINKYNIRFDSEISYCEDHLFTYNYYKYCHNILILKDTLYHHRIVTAGSLSSKFNFDGIINEAKKELDICLSIYQEFSNDDFLKIITNTFNEKLSLAFSTIFNSKYNTYEQLKKIKLIRTLQNRHKNIFILIFIFMFHKLRLNLGKIKRFFCDSKDNLIKKH